MTPLKKLMKARTHVVMRAPFFGTLLLRLQLVENAKAESLSTDGSSLYFNADYVRDATHAHLQYLCARLALASGLQHHLRMHDRQENAWQMASIFSTSHVLRENGFELPEQADPRWLGKTVEQIYAEIVQDVPPEPQSQPQGGAGDGADDQQSDQPQDDASDDDQPDDDVHPTPDEEDDQADEDERDAQGQGDDDDQGASEDRSDAPSDDNQPETRDYQGSGSLVSPDVSESERRRAEAKCKAALSAAERADPGAIAGDLEHEIRALLDPKADWRDLLRRWMTRLDEIDYTWRKPNRRFVHQRMYLPSSEPTHPTGIGHLVVLIDASASMPDDKLDAALTEIASICEEMRPEGVEIVVHDTSVRSIEHLDEGEDLDTLRVTARGGTIIEPCVTCVNHMLQHIEIACCLWFTDLEFSSHDVANAKEAWQDDVPLLWINYGAETDKPFGDEIVTMGENDV